MNQEEWKNRYRWDWRRDLYYYVLKPDEARAMGHNVPTECYHVRIYSGYIGVYLDEKLLPVGAL